MAALAQSFGSCPGSIESLMGGSAPLPGKNFSRCTVQGSSESFEVFGSVGVSAFLVFDSVDRCTIHEKEGDNFNAVGQASIAG